MTYQPHLTGILSRVSGQRVGTHKSELYTNGTYVRSEDGTTVAKLGHRNPGHRVYYLCRHDKGQLLARGVIKDEKLTARLLTYLHEYFGTCMTNCSTFAHFLTSGEFIPCTEENECFVLKQSMTTYTGQRIGVGDMLCVFYYDERYHSRKIAEDVRSSYRKSKQALLAGDTFLVNGSRGESRCYEAERVREFVTSTLFKNFHCLVCVDHYNGSPVFAHQIGLDLPGRESSAPIALTTEVFDPYGNKRTPPCLVLIKRARK